MSYNQLGERDYFALWTLVVGEVNRRPIIYTQVLKLYLSLMHAAFSRNKYTAECITKEETSLNENQGIH